MSDLESFSVNQISGQGSLPGPRSRGLCPTSSHFPSTRFPGNAVGRGRAVGALIRYRVIFRQPDSRARQFAEAEWSGRGSDFESFSVNQIPGQGTLPGPSGGVLGATWSHFPNRVGQNENEQNARNRWRWLWVTRYGANRTHEKCSTEQ